jgi:hypothetical protein
VSYGRLSVASGTGLNIGSNWNSTSPTQQNPSAVVRSYVAILGNMAGAQAGTPTPNSRSGTNYGIVVNSLYDSVLETGVVDAFTQVGLLGYCRMNLHSSRSSIMLARCTW